MCVCVKFVGKIMRLKFFVLVELLNQSVRCQISLGHCMLRTLCIVYNITQGLLGTESPTEETRYKSILWQKEKKN